MTLRHIKIFLAVVQNGCNATQAAAALHMTQPAMSLAIRELEQYYGVALFDRIGRRLRLTEAGRRFQEYAAQIDQLFDGMEKSMRDWDAFGLLRVGASVTIGSQFLPHYVRAFYSRFPCTQIWALVAPSEQLEERLMTNALDLALIEGTVQRPELCAEAYMEDHLTVVCPANGAFQNRQTLTIDEFRRQNFLLRERGSGTRELFDHITQSAGFTVAPVWEAMSTTALVNAVINGLGVAVLPYRMVAGPLARGLITAVRVEGLDFRRKFYIAYHRDKYLTSAARSFLDLCRTFEMDYPLPRYSGLF